MKSWSHEALEVVRLMRSTCCIGEIVGMAASICREHNCLPRAVYTDHLAELKELMNRGAGRDAAKVNAENDAAESK